MPHNVVGGAVPALKNLDRGWSCPQAIHSLFSFE